MITRKTKREIELMRQAGLIVATVLSELKAMIEPGISTLELDAFAEKRIRGMGGIPSFKGYQGFPASLCTSVNAQVVHGIPSKSVKLAVGDIVGVDVGVTCRGYVGDSAYTYAVGEVTKEVRALMEATEQSLYLGIQAARAGKRVGDISHAIQSFIDPLGYGIVQEYCGHGVGSSIHEEPQVPNHGRPGFGARLANGMCLAIEPMINLGTRDVDRLADGWTVVTRDRKPSAHFEHSIALTERGPYILTALTEELAVKYLQDQAVA